MKPSPMNWEVFEMTVAEAINVLTGAEGIYLAWSSFSVQINPDDMLTMDAYGRYKVKRISNYCNLNCYEIEIAIQPVKAEAV